MKTGWITYFLSFVLVSRIFYANKLANQIITL